MTEILAVHTVLLQVTDMDASLSFWRDTLGLPFAATDYGDGSYEASVGGVRLLLHEEFEPGSRRSGALLQLQVADADALHATLAARGLESRRPPQDTPWGRFFSIDTPDGYRLSFTSPPASARPS